jgi:hypothetical protein
VCVLLETTKNRLKQEDEVVCVCVLRREKSEREREQDRESVCVLVRIGERNDKRPCAGETAGGNLAVSLLWSVTILGATTIQISDGYRHRFTERERERNRESRCVGGGNSKERSNERGMCVEEREDTERERKTERACVCWCVEQREQT